MLEEFGGKLRIGRQKVQSCTCSPTKTPVRIAFSVFTRLAPLSAAMV